MRAITKLFRILPSLVLIFLMVLPCLSYGQTSGKVEYTSGVETVADPTATRFYVSPSMGMTSIIGSNALEGSGQWGFGGGLGILLSDQLLFQVSYLQRKQDLTLKTSPATPFLFSGNKVEAGFKIFMLGKDFRFRPYLGGEMAYSWNQLNYTQSALNTLGNGSIFSQEFSLKQLQGQGAVGVEIGITSWLVLDAQFALAGVVSYWAPTSTDAQGMSLYDSNKLTAANSLSRAITYSATVGMGLYF